MQIPVQTLRMLTLTWLGMGAVAAPTQASHLPDLQDRVVRLEIATQDSGREMASAVPLGGDALVTNCHAIRSAATIRVYRGGASWPARLRGGDAYRDLCFLVARGFDAAAVPTASPAGLRVGMPVYAAGYSLGEFAIRPGQIKGLHSCACANSRVIQTSAPFDRGASGGGLFDREGRLLGILTFRSPVGGDYHFALPADWLDSPGRDLALNGPSFWQNEPGSRAYFLTACALGARQNWVALDALARDWCASEPGNPEAWMALGRARLGLGRAEAAASAFQNVLRLDASHDDAVWELQKLEFDLERDLFRPAPDQSAPPAPASPG
jgi:hypothetical protein